MSYTRIIHLPNLHSCTKHVTQITGKTLFTKSQKKHSKHSFMKYNCASLFHDSFLNVKQTKFMYKQLTMMFGYLRVYGTLYIYICIHETSEGQGI